MAAETASEKPEEFSAVVLRDLYFDWSLAEHKQSTHGWYVDRLQSVELSCGRRKAEEISPADVSCWLAKRKRAAQSGKVKQDFGQSSKRGAITSIKAVWSGGEKNGYLARNANRSMERPAP